MVSIKMLRTQPGSSDGIKVNAYVKGRVYPESGPLSEALRLAFLQMGAAVIVADPVDLSTAPEMQVVDEVPRKKVKDMTVKELKEFITNTGLELNDVLNKKDLLEIALDIEDANF